MNRIEKTKIYLEEAFKESSYLSNKPHEGAYRFDHTLRVSYWGKYIAEQEGLDVEALVVGCLLHDISYTEEMPTPEAHTNHGRRSAEMVKDFVESLGFDADTTKDILYGIAIHVDNKSDFEWRDSVIARSISDADNMDRMDVYRIYESLEYQKFSKMNNDAKIAHCEQRIKNCERNKALIFATPTATKVLQDEFKYTKAFFERMLEQCQRGV